MSHQTTSANPTTVNASLSGAPNHRDSGRNAMMISEVPSMNGVVCFADNPEKVTSTPNARKTIPHDDERPRARDRLGRFRIAVTMFRMLTRHADTRTTRKVSTTPIE
jgi:hypothetical protein